MGRSGVCMGLFSNEPFEKRFVTGIADSALNIYGALLNVCVTLLNIYGAL